MGGKAGTFLVICAALGLLALLTGPFMAVAWYLGWL